ncbi:hypothetical protein L9F63_009446 [Diploptera punctata]|uniref:Prokineticin domain-containing protein n=1 Tax=Diploptera punctata TaxID=6984 RepID=A0AAD8AK96_DIPPU|nr:hypothetical protein L9F63_009446 [Diploptera punctata]
MGTYWMLAICLVIWAISAVSPMCRDSADCAPDGCCTVANMPYPTPTCNRYRAEGDTCNPSNKAFNASSSAPDGSPWYKATNVFSNICPCAPGLTCSSGKCTRV